MIYTKWPFRNKEEPKEELTNIEVKVEEPKFVPVKVLCFDPKQTKFNVGKTTVQITFEDGRKFKALIYGTIHQNLAEYQQLNKYTYTKTPNTYTDAWGT